MSREAYKSRLRAAYFWLLRSISPKHVSHGLPVWMPLSAAHLRSRIYKRLDGALDLLSTYAPARYDRTVRSLKGFLVLGTGEATRGSYDPANGVCRLSETFMRKVDTTPAAIACTVVHEATHGRLFELGIGYEEPIRHRVELLCIKAELLTAQRLPGATDEVEHCRAQMLVEPEYFSKEQFVERGTHQLRERGCPEWLIRAIVRIARKRAA